jgi:hypothetical protein
MEVNTTVRYILEIGLGIIYMIGAGFNFAYTLRNGDKFFAAFAEGTFSAGWFIQIVVLTKVI